MDFPATLARWTASTSLDRELGISPAPGQTDGHPHHLFQTALKPTTDKLSHHQFPRQECAHVANLCPQPGLLWVPQGIWGTRQGVPTPCMGRGSVSLL